MAKKKEIAPETVKEAEVSVEMSKAQLAEFTKWKADQEDKAVEEAKAEAPIRVMRMHLNFEHYINGHKYGPGRVDVPETVSGTLAYSEDQKRQGMLNLHSDNGKMFKVLMSGQSIPVPRTGEMS